MKKILILTSIGGGGHISTSSALFDYLNENYDVHTVSLFKDLLKSLDIFSKLTLNRYQGEDIYNFLICKKQFWLLKLFYKFGMGHITFYRRSIHTILIDYIKKNEFDLIISVIPFANQIILNVAKELNIPFLLIPTDLDLRTYLFKISQPNYKKFYLAIPFHDKRIIKQIDFAKIPHHHIHIIGALLRKDFYEHKNTHILKKEFNVPNDKPIIMILMGAQGSQEITKFVKLLSTISLPIHIIACMGKYNTIEKKLNSLSLPKHISLSTFTFIPHISSLMAITDILITKSGSISIFEGIYMNKPLILDGTSTILPWEEFNHHFVKQHHFGISIANYRQLIPLITSLLLNKKTLSTYKKNLKDFPKKNGREEIIQLIDKVLT